MKQFHNLEFLIPVAQANTIRCCCFVLLSDYSIPGLFTVFKATFEIFKFQSTKIICFAFDANYYVVKGGSNLILGLWVKFLMFSWGNCSLRENQTCKTGVCFLRCCVLYGKKLNWCSHIWKRANNQMFRFAVTRQSVLKTSIWDRRFESRNIWPNWLCKVSCFKQMNEILQMSYCSIVLFSSD